MYEIDKLGLGKTMALSNYVYVLQSFTNVGSK
jgi:hypothetical protein